MLCANGVGHEAVKEKGGVANGVGFRTTSTTDNIAPRVVLHHGAFITSDFHPKLLVIEIFGNGGPNNSMREPQMAVKLC